MGCCASTNKTSPPQNSLHIYNSGDSKSPPPTCPLIEEETVKEVLSETPAIATFHENHQSETQFIRTADFCRNADEKKHYQNGDVSKKPFVVFGNDELSEVASTLSGSESVSTITEMTENNGHEFHEIRRRSPAKFRNQSFFGDVKSEKTVGKYPDQRSEPYPGRIRPGPAIGSRRESSGRRRANAGSRRATMKTGRVGTGSAVRIRTVDAGKEIGENTWPPTSNELSENPPVSLECFIFL